MSTTIPSAAPPSTITPSPSTTSLPSTYPHQIPIAIIGGTGLSALPSPPFTPLAILPPPPTPWGTPSSPITVLSYTPPSPSSSTTPITIAFLVRHGPHHNLTPSEIPSRANVAALKKLGVRVAIGFSAVGSLREEVKPRDFVVAGGVVDWTKGLRGACSFFGSGVVGHVGMGEPFDGVLSGVVYSALAGQTDKQAVLQGEGVKCHNNGVVICIEGPQFSTRSESQLYRSFPLDPPINCVNMSAVPECKLFKEAEIAYALVCMSTDYDSWKEEEGVSVEMVMGHMVANGENAKRAVGAILEALGREMDNQAERRGVVGERLRGSNRGAVMGLGSGGDAKAVEAVERLTWLFGKEWVDGKV